MRLDPIYSKDQSDNKTNYNSECSSKNKQSPVPVELLIDPGVYRIISSRNSNFVLKPDSLQNTSTLSFSQRENTANELFYVISKATGFFTAYNIFHAISGRNIGEQADEIAPSAPVRLYAPSNPDEPSWYTNYISSIRPYSTQTANPFFIANVKHTDLVWYETSTNKLSWINLGSGGSFNNQFFLLERDNGGN